MFGFRASSRFSAVIFPCNQWQNSPRWAAEMTHTVDDSKPRLPLPRPFTGVQGHPVRLGAAGSVHNLENDLLYQGLFTLRPRLYNQIFRQFEVHNRLRRYIDIPVAGQSRDGCSSATTHQAAHYQPYAAGGPAPPRQSGQSNVYPCPFCYWQERGSFTRRPANPPGPLYDLLRDKSAGEFAA